MSYATQLGYQPTGAYLSQGHNPNQPLQGAAQYPEASHRPYQEHAAYQTHWRTFILGQYTQQPSVQNLFSNMVTANGWGTELYKRMAKTYTLTCMAIQKNNPNFMQDPHALQYIGYAVLWLDYEVKAEITQLRNQQNEQGIAQWFQNYDQVVKDQRMAAIVPVVKAVIQDVASKSQQQGGGMGMGMSMGGGGMPMGGAMQQGGMGMGQQQGGGMGMGMGNQMGAQQVGFNQPAGTHPHLSMTGQPQAQNINQSPMSMMGSPFDQNPQTDPVMEAVDETYVEEEVEDDSNTHSVGGWRRGMPDNDPETFGLRKLSSKEFKIRGENYEVTAEEVSRLGVLPFDEAVEETRNFRDEVQKEWEAHKEHSNPVVGTESGKVWMQEVASDSSEMAKRNALFNLAIYKTGYDCCSIMDPAWSYESLWDLMATTCGADWHEGIDNSSLAIVELADRQYLLLDSTDFEVARFLRKQTQFHGWKDRRGRKGHYYMLMPEFDFFGKDKKLTIKVVNFYNKEELVDFAMYEPPAFKAPVVEDVESEEVVEVAEDELRLIEDTVPMSGSNIPAIAEMATQRLAMTNPAFKVGRDATVTKASSLSVVILKTEDEQVFFDKLLNIVADDEADMGKAIHEHVLDNSSNPRLQSLVAMLDRRISALYTRHIRGAVGLEEFYFDNSWLTEYEEVSEHFQSNSVSEAERAFFAEEERLMLQRSFKTLNNDEKWERRDEVQSITGCKVKSTGGSRRLYLSEEQGLNYQTAVQVLENPMLIYQVPVDSQDLGLAAGLLYGYSAALPGAVLKHVNAKLTRDLAQPIIITKNGMVLEVFGPSYHGDHDHQLFMPKLSTRIG